MRTEYQAIFAPLPPKTSCFKTPLDHLPPDSSTRIPAAALTHTLASRRTPAVAAAVVARALTAMVDAAHGQLEEIAREAAAQSLRMCVLEATREEKRDAQVCVARLDFDGLVLAP